MPTDIGREDVQRLVAQGAPLVEVLPEEAFDEQDLPGAIHLPLRKIEAGATGRPWTPSDLSSSTAGTPPET